MAPASNSDVQVSDERLRAVLDALADAGLSLATAESLTGGALSARIVDIPGASRVFLGGVTSYATRLKAELLCVDAQLLHDVGPVDPRVAQHMARGVCALTGADIGLATTGVAGPDSVDGHAPGTVFIACAALGDVQVRHLQLRGTRAQIRMQTVDAALHLLAEVAKSAALLKGD